MSGSVKGEKCGYCGGKFPATETPTDYFKECDLCKKTFYLKRNCAKKMLAKQQKISTSEINLVPAEFKNMNIKLVYYVKTVNSKNVFIVAFIIQPMKWKCVQSAKKSGVLYCK